MDIETCIGILMSLPFFIIPTILLERLCSCYFPYLLSAKIYYTVKNRRLQNLLIAHQRTRSADSKTKREDQNKLPFIGCIYCAVTFPWLLSEIIIVLLFLILNIIKPGFVVSPFMNILKNICFLLFTSYYFWVFAVSMPLLYLADYSLGLRRWQKRQKR